MKRLFLSLFLASSLLIEGSTMAFASDSHSNANIKSIFDKAITSTSTTDSEMHYATLKSKDGKGISYKVKVIPCETPSNATAKSNLKLSSSNGNLKSQSYVFSLDKNNMTPLSSSDESDKTKKSWDSTDSVKGILTVYYLEKNNGVLLTEVSGSWDIEDDHVSVSPNWVIYADIGTLVYQWKQKSLGSRLDFDVDTNFTEYANTSSGVGGAGATSDSTLTDDDGDSWDFMVLDPIFGNIPLESDR